MKNSGPQTRQSTRKKIKKSLGPDFLDPSSIGLHGGKNYIEEYCELCKKEISSSKKEVTSCRRCGQVLAHNNCIRERVSVRHTKSPWVCTECKPCYRCDSMEKREGHIVFCMGCKAPYHFSCALKYRFEGICVLCNTHRIQCKKDKSDGDNEKASTAKDNNTPIIVATTSESEKSPDLLSSCSTSGRHMTPRNKEFGPIASTSKRGTRSSDRSFNKQSTNRFEPRKSRRSTSEVSENSYGKKTVATFEAETEKEDEFDSNLTKEESEEENIPIKEELMHVLSEAVSTDGINEPIKDELAEIPDSQAESDESKTQEIILETEVNLNCAGLLTSTNCSKTNDDQNIADKPEDSTQNTSFNGKPCANGISSRIMKDANPNGAKKLKSILFERVCKIGGLLPAQTSEWTIEDVNEFVKFIGFPEEAASFSDRQIDGKSLLLLTREDVLTQFKLKLGPALKIYAHIFCLQRKKPSLLLGE